MRRFLFACVVLALTSQARAEETGPPSPPVDFDHLPWKNGETLTYLVSMGPFEAAEGAFAARDRGDHWEFKLKLHSRGILEKFYPFSGYFWSRLGDGLPWRSVEYGEYRFEPSRVIKERTRIDYAAQQGTREFWATKDKPHKFTVEEDSLDDVGTMLYHLRTGTWKPGDRRLLHVYESDSEKEALAECDARETMAFGNWPRQPMLHLLVLPGKGTHHRGRLSLWMTDDSRHLPLHADLNFRYGAVTIDLERMIAGR